jgi:hypothetical protein
MNLLALEKRLMAVARNVAPDDRVPYAFEKRIMAGLTEAAPADPIGFWGRALWVCAAPCVALALGVCVWSLWQGRGLTANGDFPKEFETAVLVASDQSSAQW